MPARTSGGAAQAPAQNNDSIGVGAFGVVTDAPAVRCLGKFLLVHHDEQPVERQPFRSLPYQAFQQDLAVADLADLEGDVAAGRTTRANSVSVSRTIACQRPRCDAAQ